MKIKILGAHNCETLKTRLSGVVIDEVIALDAGGLTSGLSLGALKKLGAVILSHRHYDHIRDIPALGMNLYLSKSSTDIYTTSDVIETLNNHCFTSGIYMNFSATPEDNPSLRLNEIEPMEPFSVVGYEILAVPVIHSVPTVGYQVTSPDTKSIFYTSDTGPGLADCWQQISPQLIIIEVTSSNRFDDYCAATGHLTPNLLRVEMGSFREVHNYLPDVIIVHMSPELENEIRGELELVSDELNCRITPGYEGMEISL